MKEWMEKITKKDVEYIIVIIYFILFYYDLIKIERFKYVLIILTKLKEYLEKWKEKEEKEYKKIVEKIRGKIKEWREEWEKEWEEGKRNYLFKN